VVLAKAFDHPEYESKQVAPGICDGISARCAIEAGFDCLYQSGAATTASRLGQPDLAIATLNDFAGVSLESPHDRPAYESSSFYTGCRDGLQH
jgi:hypothetical protein